MEINKSNKIENMCPNVNETKKKKKKRCFFEGCNKKLDLTATQCKCCGFYCPAHRLPEDHQCTYDFVKLGKERLAKNNPLIVNNKIIPI